MNTSSLPAERADQCPTEGRASLPTECFDQCPTEGRASLPTECSDQCPTEGRTSFDGLNLIEPIRRALRAQNYQVPTPIQAQAIPVLLAGHDLLGSAQTGSGKTAAFALPILQHLAQNNKRPPRGGTRALVLAPTRELAAQIADSFSTYGRYLGLRKALVYGGVNKRPQIAAIAPGVDILIATPGRLLDIQRDGRLQLNQVEIFVLDEADRMLDMGFIPDIRKVIASLPSKRQSVFFSATMPREVTALAQSMLSQPVRIAIPPEAGSTPQIEQRVLFVDRESKTPLLLNLLEDSAIRRALVFTRTKHRANRLAEQLAKGRIKADAIHGNKNQGARERALDGFHAGRIRVLVATDIAARGIDVDDISHVINFELPNEPQSYVHRIGRTARAGKEGIAISFCDASESAYLRDIEKLLKHSIPVMRGHPFHSAAAAATPLASLGNTGGRRTSSGGMTYGNFRKGRNPFRSRRS
jgi:ATP-dependent RNA helicase RhlE